MLIKEGLKNCLLFFISFIISFGLSMYLIQNVELNWFISIIVSSFSGSIIYSLLIAKLQELGLTIMGTIEAWVILLIFQIPIHLIIKIS